MSKRTGDTLLCIVFVASALAALLGQYVASWLKEAKSADIAAWVQAIGAVVGIGVAIFVPWAQRRNEVAKSERADRDRDIANIALVRELAIDLRALVAESRERLAAERFSAGDLDGVRYEDFLARLRMVDVVNLPAAAFADVARMRRILARVHGQATQGVCDGGVLDQCQDEAEALGRRAQETLRRVINGEPLRRRRGSRFRGASSSNVEQRL